MCLVVPAPSPSEGEVGLGWWKLMALLEETVPPTRQKKWWRETFNSLRCNSGPLALQKSELSLFHTFLFSFFLKKISIVDTQEPIRDFFYLKNKKTLPWLCHIYYNFVFICICSVSLVKIWNGNGNILCCTSSQERQKKWWGREHDHISVQKMNENQNRYSTRKWSC